MLQCKGPRFHCLHALCVPRKSGPRGTVQDKKCSQPLCALLTYALLHKGWLHVLSCTVRVDFDLQGRQKFSQVLLSAKADDMVTADSTTVDCT